jgi:hypothetical protein
MKNLPEILAKEIFDLYKSEVRETLMDYSQVWDSGQVEDSDDFAKIEAKALKIFVKQLIAEYAD